MKNEKIDNIICVLGLCGAIAFLLGLADPWAFIASFIFGGAAAVVALFKDRG